MRPWTSRTARLITFVSLAASTGCFSGSASDGAGGGGGGGVGGEAPTGTPIPLQVTVTDESGDPVLDAVLSIDGRVVETTGADGVYEATAIATGPTIGVRVRAEGYVPHVQRIPVGDMTELRASASLMGVGTTEEVDPGVGARISDGFGSAELPGGGFVDADGEEVTEPIQVTLTFVPPEQAAATGTFEIAGSDDQVLQSLGILVLTATTADGEEVQLAPGQTIEIAMPADVPGGSIPPGTDMPPTWSQNTVDGGWDPGGGTFDFDGGEWFAQVDSIASWNCDYPSRVTCVRGTLRTTGGDPLGGAVVQGTMTGEAAGFLPASTVLNATTGSEGTFCMEVVPRSQITLTVTCPDGPSATLGPLPAPSSEGDRCAGGSCTSLGTLEVCCRDDSDCEEGEICESGVCVADCEDDAFVCGDGSCIPSSQVCNGADDCPGGEDENPDTCDDPAQCCVATNGCPEETGSSCADSCCCCPGGQACCADQSGCCAAD